jgi:hypothetical protein
LDDYLIVVKTILLYWFFKLLFHFPITDGFTAASVVGTGAVAAATATSGSASVIRAPDRIVQHATTWFVGR